jgi:hypothetical protein
LRVQWPLATLSSLLAVAGLTTAENRMRNVRTLRGVALAAALACAGVAGAMAATVAPHGATAALALHGATAAPAQCDSPDCGTFEPAPVPPEPVIEPIYEDPEAMTPPIEGRGEPVAPAPAPSAPSVQSPGATPAATATTLPDTGTELLVVAVAAGLVAAGGAGLRRWSRPAPIR